MVTRYNMATYCIEGRLNKFVKPESEGGREIQVTILSLLATQNMTDNAMYDWIQASELDAEIKSLTQLDVKKIMAWMDKEGLIGKAETQEITYFLGEEPGARSIPEQPKKKTRKVKK